MPPKKTSRRRKNRGTQADEETAATTTGTTTTTQASVDDEGKMRGSRKRAGKKTITPGAEKVYARKKKTKSVEDKSFCAPSAELMKPSGESKEGKAKKEEKSRGRKAGTIADPEDVRQELGKADPHDLKESQVENLRKFVEQVQQTGVQALLDEYETLKGYEAEPFKHDAFDGNQEKNRYKDKLCLDATRVKLQDGLNGDYIHANWVDKKPFQNRFIATQGPLEKTAADFWRMVVQENVGYIFMLCDFVELGKDKCAKYLPQTVGDTMTFKDITVKLEKVLDDDFVFSKLLVSSPAKGKKFVNHLRWKDWPDHGVPQNAMPALRLLRHARVCSQPSVVHCSAGVGRTGTLIAIEYLLQKICATPPPYDLKEMLKWMRNQRSHAIQTAPQYAFITFVVFRLLIEKDRSMLGELNKFQGELNALCGAKVEAVGKSKGK